MSDGGGYVGPDSLLRYVTIAELIRFLNASSFSSSGWEAGGDAQWDLARMVAATEDWIDDWAPDAVATDPADLEQLHRAKREAVIRQTAYSMQRGFFRNSRSEVDLLPGQGSAGRLHSGALEVLVRWHPISGGLIE